MESVFFSFYSVQLDTIHQNRKQIERWNIVLWKVIRSYQDNKETFDQNVSKCWNSFFLIQAQTQYERFHISCMGCCYSSSSQCHNFAESIHAGKQYEFVISRNSKFLQHWLIDHWINRILRKSNQCSSCYTCKVLSNYLRLEVLLAHIFGGVTVHSASHVTTGPSLGPGGAFKCCQVSK